MQINLEDYTDINGCDGLYKINKQGNVLSMPMIGSNRVNMLKTHTNEKGYKYVCLRKNNRTIKAKISRLVAQTFIPNTQNKAEVNHIDGDKANNNVDNLEWCTRQENMNHAWSTGLKKGIVIERKLSIEKAKEIREKKKSGISNAELARIYNVSPTNISLLIKNKIYKFV